MGDPELLGMLDETKDELLNLKFQNATGQLDNTNLLAQTRRQVARIQTELRIREIQEAEQMFAGGGAPSSERTASERTADERAADERTADERTADAEGDDLAAESQQPPVESKPLKKKRKSRNRSNA